MVEDFFPLKPGLFMQKDWPPAGSDPELRTESVDLAGGPIRYRRPAATSCAHTTQGATAFLRGKQHRFAGRRDGFSIRKAPTFARCLPVRHRVSTRTFAGFHRLANR